MEKVTAYKVDNTVYEGKADATRAELRSYILGEFASLNPTFRGYFSEKDFQTLEYDHVRYSMKKLLETLELKKAQIEEKYKDL